MFSFEPHLEFALNLDQNDPLAKYRTAFHIPKDEHGNDKWAKGETTARNERRYVLQMQQGDWDYKSDGIKQLKYELVDVTQINKNAKMINVKLDGKRGTTR